MNNFEIKNNDCHAALAMTKSVQSGRSMIEMLGVLAIIGVLSVGGIAGYSKAMMKYRINKTIEQITLIAGNVRTFFAPQGNYAGLDLSTNTGKAIIQKAKLVPDEMLIFDRSTGKITGMTSAFGESINSFGALDKSEGTFGGDNKAFGIWFTNIPEEACVELITYDWTSAGVKIITSPDVDTKYQYLHVPVDIDTSVKFCEDGHSFWGLLFDVDF
ncbi:MAG: hypothetical protein IKO06_06390 [Alphaproteobacteria bacterium]|nr:hypothetical protein [Alphaproteobacteria bacterium]